MKVFIYHPQIREEYVRIFDELRPDIPLSDDPKEADVVFGWKVPGEYLHPNLKWYQSMGAGVDDVVLYLKDRDILLTRVEDLFAERMAEYVLAYMLALSQDVKSIFKQQEEKKWLPFTPGLLASQSVLILGVGSIGKRIGFLLNQVGMTVYGLARKTTDAQGFKYIYSSKEDLVNVYGKIDFVVNVMPLTEVTRDFLSGTEFDLMAKNPYLINVGRAHTLVEEDTYQALKSGQLKGAILDVFWEEPLSLDSPWWQLGNVIVTPHLSGPSVPKEVAQFFFANYNRFIKKQDLKGLVDFTAGY